MALSAIEVLQNSRLNIPEDISITGFDDIMPASLVNPHSQQSVPLYSMAQKAVDEVLRMIGATSGNINIFNLKQSWS